MSKEIDNIFIDVRNAFRLLNTFQERVLQIVTYIREQTPFTDMWGSKNWYSDEVSKRRNSPDPEYAKLAVSKDMWGWDFLYGYIFEYYFGNLTIDKKTVEMSVFQISDDGFFISGQEKKEMTNMASFEASEHSHSYYMFNISVSPNDNCDLWLSDPEFPDDNWKDFLTKFLSSSSDMIITRNDEGNITVLKKYEMQRFCSQSRADEVIRDFGRLLKENAGIELFKKVFYE